MTDLKIIKERKEKMEKIINAVLGDVIIYEKGEQDDWLYEKTFKLSDRACLEKKLYKIIGWGND